MEPQRLEELRQPGQPSIEQMAEALAEIDRLLLARQADAAQIERLEAENGRLKTRDEEDQFFDDEEGYGGERYCWDCGGRGWKITCPDDLCHGNDECIHGDPPTRCWTCNRDGSREDWL